MGTALRHQSDDSIMSLEEKPLQSLVDKIVWMCCVRRPLLSLLRCAVLPWAITLHSARISSAQELRQFGKLATLATIDIYRPLSTIILNADASEMGVLPWLAAQLRKIWMIYLLQRAITADCYMTIRRPFAVL